MSQLVRAWREFWFTPPDLVCLGAFRIVFGLTLFAMYSVRAFDFDLFFSSNSFVPFEKAPDVFVPFLKPMFFWYPTSDFAAVTCYVVFLSLLLFLVLGLLPRVLVFVTFLLHLAFIQRNFSIIYGADMMVSHFLFFLSWTPSHLRLSVLNRFKTSSKKTCSCLVGSAGFRFLQLQLCAVYFYTGLEKVRGESWWDGSAIWRVLGDRLMVSLELSFLQHWAPVIAVLTYMTLVFEIFFPAAMISKRFRVPWLMMGCCLHFGIAAIMNLPFFSLVMTSVYLLFLPSNVIESSIDRLSAKKAWISQALKQAN